MKKTVMFTGDDEKSAQLLPNQKVELEKLDKKKRSGSKLAFIAVLNAMQILKK